MWDLNADHHHNQTEQVMLIEEEAENNNVNNNDDLRMINDCATSTSSVSNNAAVGTHTASRAFTFDFMKGNSNIAASSAGEQQQRQRHASSTAILLSSAAQSVGGSGSSSSATSSKSDWLNLSFPDSGEPPEMSIFNPRHQQQTQQTMPVKKSRRGPRSRSSQYRGVTFYRRTGRWESHIWDCGKQVYLGGFDTAHAAARAYDRAAIKFRGTDADINFNIADYQEDIGQMKNLSKEEFVHVLRRQTTGFSRGSSKYRGLTLHKCGRWEARMGQLLGKKATDVAALPCNGGEAATDFEPSTHNAHLASHVIKHDASGHDLDLSLSIDSSSEYNPICHAFRIESGNGPKVITSSSSGSVAFHAFHGQLSMSDNYPTTSQGPAIRTGNNLPVSYEVQSMVVPSSSRTPNWGWQHQQGHNSRTIFRPQPFHSVASSGFSFSSSVNPATSMQPARQSYPYQNSCNKP